MKRIGEIIISIFLIALVFLSCIKKESKVLIIGDSISIGYTPFVKHYFKGNTEVLHNPGNAQHTGKGLANIEEWIGDGKWDIVQINWGFWDMCYRSSDSNIQGKRDKLNGEITFSIKEYETQLDAIVSVIKNSTDAKIIFVTSTYVPKDEPGRYTEDPIKYNEIAKRVMKKHNITVNDIYKQSILIHNKYGKGDDDVHYTKKGYEELSKHIIEFLNKNL